MGNTEDDDHHNQHAQDSLSPNTTGESTGSVSRRRSLFRSLNPFSSSRSSNATGSGSSLSRALSGRDSNPNPMRNPSPPTRRPRAQSPPPAYTEEVNTASGPTLGASPCYERFQNGAHPAISVSQSSTAEDPYAFLNDFDTIFLIDDSGSMAGRSWRETEAALLAILPICIAHDRDGIDVYYLNHQTGDPGDPSKGSAGTGYRGVKSVREVENIFRSVRPQMATPTGTRLGNILRPYVRHYEDLARQTEDLTCLKPINIIVITDGVPSDDVEAVVIQVAKKLDKLDAPPYQIGIQFFQVGKEIGAADALRSLDDELSRHVIGGIRDIVDTATFDSTTSDSAPVLTGEGILKTVLGAVVKRLDRKESNLRRR